MIKINNYSRYRCGHSMNECKITKYSRSFSGSKCGFGSAWNHNLDKYYSTYFLIKEVCKTSKDDLEKLMEALK